MLRLIKAKCSILKYWWNFLPSVTGPWLTDFAFKQSTGLLMTPAITFRYQIISIARKRFIMLSLTLTAIFDIEAVSTTLKMRYYI